MGYEHFERPARGEVWFYDGARVDARVFGVEDGFAVAEVAKRDLERLFEGVADVDDDETGWVTLTGRAGRERLRVERGRVYLGGSWPLRYELAARQPRKRR